MNCLSKPQKSTVRYGNMPQAALPRKTSVLAANSGSRLPRVTEVLEQPANGILDPRFAPYALWLLRLTVGVVFLQHVMRLIFGYEPADTTQLFGLPSGVSPFAVAWQATIGLALIYGLWPRVAAVAGAATLTVAAIASHGAASPYGWQMPVLWIAASLAYALAGDGAFVLVPSRSVFHTELRK